MSSRYHNRQEMFSRRRPSCTDSLHFVKTDKEEGSEMALKWGITEQITCPETVERVLTLEILDSLCGDGENGDGKGGQHGGARREGSWDELPR